MEQNIQLTKLPPFASEAEQLFLGSILNNDALFDEVIINPQIFYYKQHQIIYKAMIHLRKKKEKIDAYLVSQIITEFDLKLIGGFDYLNKLVEIGIPTSIISYSEIIKKTYVQRQAIQLTRNFMDNCFEPNVDINNQLITLINQLSQINIHDRLDIYYLTDIIDKIMLLRQQNPEYIPTNDNYLDKCLDGGLARGELIILAGRPSMGKTSVAINLFSNLAKSTKIIYFSLEMTLEEITWRLHNNLSGTDIKDDMNEIQADELMLGLACRKHLAIVDNPHIDLIAIKTYLTKYKLENDSIDVIIIDYLQIMKRPSTQREYDFISNMTRELKLLAKEFNITIICLSQLSRNGTERRDKHPLLADLRGSGSIEQDADIVLFIHREEYYLAERGESVPHELQGMLELIIAKFRRGIQNKLLYHCNLLTNKLIPAELETKSKYINFLRNQGQNKIIDILLYEFYKQNLMFLDISCQEYERKLKEFIQELQI